MSPDYIMVFMAMILELRPPYLRIKDDVLKYVQVTGGGLLPTFIRDPFEYPRRQRGR